MARLLDRQVRLLKYLTSGDAIFRESGNRPLDAGLRGIDPVRLHCEARFSHEKRMQKIAAVLPKTFDLLGVERGAVLREFAAACPPLDISRIRNARQFHAFLAARWRGRAPVPPYLFDVAGFELACAEARIDADRASAVEPTLTGPRSIRRRPGVALVRTSFDIRPIFESDRKGVEPIQREVLQAIACHAGEPHICDLTREVFDLLAALDSWASVTKLFDADRLIDELTEAGLLEVRR